MLCCNKRKKKIDGSLVTRKIKLEIQQTQDINDEAMTLYQTQNFFNNSNLFHNTNDLQSYRYRTSSNYKESRSVEKLIQNLPSLSPRQSSFKSFKYCHTSPDTKFISQKQGFTLLITKSPKK
ncbi:unnamed protein product [Paramecium sonneborni]|uniref:Homing endonuclease LAGLIDADG domain-containing protein n=1 Tax=Paramecium sonneborni TaxID=65129 RepID=A0A8S1LT43_9CILI|nr:unnamed protein product [Paramecium sonneborni]CAD8065726.1 unnamed protein product [Paramecium sonneborni]